jgi:hypothetical protein
MFLNINDLTVHLQLDGPIDAPPLLLCIRWVHQMPFGTRRWQHCGGPSMSFALTYAAMA